MRNDSQAFVIPTETKIQPEDGPSGMTAHCRPLLGVEPRLRGDDDGFEWTTRGTATQPQYSGKIPAWLIVLPQLSYALS